MDVEDLTQQLFGSRAYAELNGCGAEYRDLTVSDDRGVLLRWSGILLDGLWESGFSAPFGGPDVRVKALRPSAIHGAVDELVEWAKAEGFERLRVRSRPIYGSAEAMVQQALLTKGFDVVAAELNHHVVVAGLSSPEAYSAVLGRSQRKSLRRAMDRGDTYVQLPPSEWQDAYELLTENRANKGHSLKLSLEYLLDAADGLLGAVRISAVRSAGELVAAAVVYRVLPDVAVVVYWGDARHDLAPSPMHALAAGVTIEAAQGGVRVLDLGISSLDGVPDDGLDRFKRTMLATATPRLIFEREVS